MLQDFKADYRSKVFFVQLAIQSISNIKIHTDATSRYADSILGKIKALIVGEAFVAKIFGKLPRATTYFQNARRLNFLEKSYDLRPCYIIERIFIVDVIIETLLK